MILKSFNQNSPYVKRFGDPRPAREHACWEVFICIVNDETRYVNVFIPKEGVFI